MPDPSTTLLPVVPVPLVFLLKKESILKRESSDEVCFFAESKVLCMLANRFDPVPGAILMVSGWTGRARRRRRMRREAGVEVPMWFD